MSVSDVPEKVKVRLWGKAGGRCQYEGCNARLWLDELTQSEFNVAYIAHIVADSPKGPRGDAVLSELLKADISNLMLLCDQHHRLVDTGDLAGHPADRLREMKRRHEDRIDIATDIAEGQTSHVLLYGATVGAHSTATVSFEAARQALLPSRYPAERAAIELGFHNSTVVDRDSAYWEMEHRQLQNAFKEKVRERRARRDGARISHLSVFALAPQPLLIALGLELGDIDQADVFQLRREPPGWRLEGDREHAPLDLSLTEPVNTDGPPALVLSISGEIASSRATAVLEESASIWRLDVPAPNNDIVRCRAHLSEFRAIARRAFNAIKAAHGSKRPLHIFPAMPVSLAVELGRVWMPKSDLPLTIFDQMEGRFVRP